MANINIESVRRYFVENGCKLLEEVYVDSHTKMTYICRCGSRAITTWNRFKNGHKCLNCYGKKRITIGYLKEYFQQQGCTLLEEVYVPQAKMKYICVCGTESTTYWHNFKRGCRCRGCMAKNNSGENSHWWNPNREQVRLNELTRKKYYHALRKTLQAIGKRKTKKSGQLLGYTANELLERLESFPEWMYLKDQNWSLDHIFPISAFLDHNIFDPKIINALDNLQPILHSTNCSKRDKYDEQSFVSWLLTKGIVL